jgi:hypothetical protein
MKGDSFGVQGTFSEGASGYATRATGAWQVYGSGNQEAMGFLVDGVFRGTGAAGNPFTGVSLTDVWSFNAVYEHLWSAKWRTSIYGGATGVTYNAAAKASLCNTGSATNVPAATPASFGGSVTFQTPGQCNPNFSWWSVGTRTQWNPHPDIDIGVDVLYTQLNTANRGTATLTANGARPAGTYTIQDQGVWSAMMRWQRNFIP